MGILIVADGNRVEKTIGVHGPAVITSREQETSVSVPSGKAMRTLANCSFVSVDTEITFAG